MADILIWFNKTTHKFRGQHLLSLMNLYLVGCLEYFCMCASSVMCHSDTFVVLWALVFCFLVGSCNVLEKKEIE